MLHSPSVSTIIPCRNAALWIEAAVTSALAQSVAAHEIIVVDDGSSDDSLARLEKFGSRIRLIRQPAQGGNAARNAGLVASTGEWLQFLDADDYLEPDKISRQLAEAAPGAPVLYSPVFMETWREGRASGRTVPLIDTAADLWMQWISWQLPQTGGVLWRREALLALGGWKAGQPCCQEHELYLRALQAGLRWSYCPTPGAVYRIWSEDTVCRRDPRRVIRERTRLIDAALSWLDQNGRLLPIHTDTAGLACFEMARTWARDDPTEAAAYYAERKNRSLIRLAGPAAPISYRLALSLLGFAAAERLAAWSRT